MAGKVLVTGGAGFIGSAFIRHLQAQGDEVFVVDDLSFGRRELVDVPEGRFHQVDIRDRAAMRRLVTDIAPDRVLHLAAVHFIPYCNQHPVLTADINICGTMSVLDACAGSATVAQVFVASTAAVYPIMNEAVNEEQDPGPLDIYGITKLATERLAREYHLRTGVPVIIGRFFNAFGPNETNAHLIPEIQRQVLSGTRRLRLGNLEPKRDFIHTDDMGRAMTALLNAVQQGCEVFNIGRGKEYSVREVVQAFERQLGEPLEIEVDPERVRKVERMHLLADIGKLTRTTGWAPRWSLDEGVATLLREDLSHIRS
jgi:UDP-glucose 4-epimerase